MYTKNASIKMMHFEQDTEFAWGNKALILKTMILLIKRKGAISEERE